MKLETPRDRYVDELKDLYNAEHQLHQALPQTLTDHLEEAKETVINIEAVTPVASD